MFEYSPNPCALAMSFSRWQMKTTTATMVFPFRKRILSRNFFNSSTHYGNTMRWIHTRWQMLKVFKSSLVVWPAASLMHARCERERQAYESDPHLTSWLLGRGGGAVLRTTRDVLPTMGACCLLGCVCCLLWGYVLPTIGVCWLLLVCFILGVYLHPPMPMDRQTGVKTLPFLNFVGRW